MDDQKKGGYWKFALVFAGIIILVWAGLIALRIYNEKQDQRAAEQFTEDLKKENQADYDRAFADTYGGKTPQETLRLYIEAVEKGDYVLAGKYFVADYHERETQKLQNNTRENIEKIIKLLKMDIEGEGSFSENKTEYGIVKPFLINFRLYPSGNWKIIKI